jgi:hypothetical protein
MDVTAGEPQDMRVPCNSFPKLIPTSKDLGVHVADTDGTEIDFLDFCTPSCDE